jgi:hypothetical protein
LRASRFYNHRADPFRFNGGVVVDRALHARSFLLPAATPIGAAAFAANAASIPAS